ncbi:MAG: hypothetical protein HY746_06565 [Elusimicrobia bacterium]|nr:hypothetical protein [Elusimicrobiota bacterium]
MANFCLSAGRQGNYKTPCQATWQARKVPGCKIAGNPFKHAMRKNTMKGLSGGRGNHANY